MSVEIKICGINTVEALDAARAAGADLVGFVAFPRSPRHLSDEAMAALAARLGEGPRKVLLTVNAGDDELARLIAAAHPDLLQLHGAETPERVALIRQKFGLPVMKAIAVREAADLAVVPAYAAVSDRLLFDARPPAGSSLPGGNGEVFDWTLLRGLDPGRPLMLSGGLDPSNVAQAIAGLPLDGVDVSSGVESAPGVKSAEKIAAFVAAARQAGRSEKV